MGRSATGMWVNWWADTAAAPSIDKIYTLRDVGSGACPDIVYVFMRVIYTLPLVHVTWLFALVTVLYLNLLSIELSHL